MSQYIQPRFDFTTAIAGVGPGVNHTSQRVVTNAMAPAIFNEYERLFNTISAVVGDYSFSETFTNYPVGKNNIGDVVRFLYSDYRALTTSLDARKFETQGGTISGDVLITGKLQVKDDVTYNDTVTFLGTINAGSSVEFGSTALFYGKITSLAGIEIKLDSTFKNNLTVNETLTTKNLVAEQFICSSTSSFNALLTVESLHVTNSSVFYGSISALDSSFAGQVSSTYLAGSPFNVASKILCVNLNSDLLDGYEAGNLSGQVAVSNGTKCTALNSDLIDGYHAGNTAGQVALSNGALCNSLNADLLEGFHGSQTTAASTVVIRNSYGDAAANRFTADVATGNAPLVITSTTKCANLNVDLLDDYHVGTSGNCIPVMSAANTWSGVQTFSSRIVGDISGSAGTCRGAAQSAVTCTGNLLGTFNGTPKEKFCRTINYSVYKEYSTNYVRTVFTISASDGYGYLSVGCGLYTNDSWGGFSILVNNDCVFTAGICSDWGAEYVVSPFIPVKPGDEIYIASPTDVLSGRSFPLESTQFVIRLYHYL